MASSSSAASAAAVKKPKKVNLLDHVSVKHLLDESVTETVIAKGFVEDVRWGNLRMLLALTSIAVALTAHFYPKKFPDNEGLLVACILLYVSCCGLVMLIAYAKQKNAILFTKPLEGSLASTGLMVSSRVPRYSDMYTLTIASADQKSTFPGRQVQLTKSVTKWFTEDGFLVEGLLWKDVERLLNDYSRDLKKRDLA